MIRLKNECFPRVFGHLGGQGKNLLIRSVEPASLLAISPRASSAATRDGRGVDAMNARLSYRFFPSVIPFQSSVRNGRAGSPA